MRNAIFLLSIILISCKNPSSKGEADAKLVLGSIEIDTLFSDIYAWPYFVTPEENIYFIKKNNTLFLNNDSIMRIPNFLGAERFVISKDYMAFSFKDTTFIDVVNIYCLKNHVLVKRMDNRFAVDALFEENSFILNEFNAEGRDVYAVKTDEVVFRLTEYESSSFIGPSKIYTYNALRLRDENGLLKVNVYDKNTFAKGDELIIGNPQGRMAEAFLDDFYVAANGSTIFFVDFQGKDFGEITLPTNNKYQILVTSDNTVSFYFWDADIGEEYGDFNLLRKKVTVVNNKPQN